MTPLPPEKEPLLDDDTLATISILGDVSVLAKLAKGLLGKEAMLSGSSHCEICASAFGQKIDTVIMTRVAILG
jgi:hypothetical protein